MYDLQGKQVLFVGPQTFGYEIEIANEMRRRGAEVDFLPDRLFTSPLMKAAMRLRRDWVLPFADRFVMRSIEAFGRGSYDVIFVVGGEGLSVRTLPMLRASFPTAAFVLYLWDALRNKRLLDRNLPFFDQCITFDADDAKTYGMQFRPLFFSPGFACSPSTDFQYHLSFIGTAHSDRVKIVSNIMTALPDQTDFYRYLYLQAPWMFWVHKLGNPAYREASIKDFRFAPLPRAEVQSIFLNSLAILDIEHPGQTGLTMRTFETMGANKKLVTTNPLVKESDFFNPENILVIDRFLVPNIPDSFLRTPYVLLPDAIYQKYSLAGWLKDVLPHSAR